MAEEEHVSSHQEENEDAFPRGHQAFVRPSLTCIDTGRLTEIPGPCSAESSFNMWPKGGPSSQSQSLTKNKAPSLQSASASTVRVEAPGAVGEGLGEGPTACPSLNCLFCFLC